MMHLLTKTDDIDVENSDTFGNYMVHGIDEILVPEPVSWIPQTWGWWIVFALLLVYGVYKGYGAYRHWFRNRYRQAALQQLENVRRSADPAIALQTLPTLLKATALHAFSRRRVAALSGQAWLRFLDQQYDGPKFESELGHLLVDAAYRPLPADEYDWPRTEQLIDQCQQWIEQHRNEEAA